LPAPSKAERVWSRAHGVGTSALQVQSFVVGAARRL
jgi:hypothetical protein